MMHDAALSSGQFTRGRNGGQPTHWKLLCLGVHDQLVAWLKPKTYPSWLARGTLAALPDS
jgi:hypothetical protein